MDPASPAAPPTATNALARSARRRARLAGLVVLAPLLTLACAQSAGRDRSPRPHAGGEPRADAVDHGSSARPAVGTALRRSRLGARRARPARAGGRGLALLPDAGEGVHPGRRLPAGASSLRPHASTVGAEAEPGAGRTADLRHSRPRRRPGPRRKRPRLGLLHEPRPGVDHFRGAARGARGPGAARPDRHHGAQVRGNVGGLQRRGRERRPVHLRLRPSAVPGDVHRRRGDRLHDPAAGRLQRPLPHDRQARRPRAGARGRAAGPDRPGGRGAIAAAGPSPPA